MHTLSTPKELGYRFPAEWEPQEAVWFAWPTRTDLWDGVLDKVRDRLAELYVLSARFEKVRVLCPAAEQAALRERMVRAGDASQVELLDYETDDVWCRDYGPLFLLNEESTRVCIADWEYNAWGDKFPLQEKDRHAAAWIAKHLGVHRFAFDTVLEGGAIESNGEGQILTTEAVLLNPNRNGALSKQAIASRMMAGLGADQVLWLGGGLVGDDTDGHIDNLARFFKADGIIIADPGAPESINYKALKDNLERVYKFRTPEGNPYDCMRLPLPDPIQVDGEPLAASYLNYLVLNGGVIVPTYCQPENDEEALAIIGDCYPGREVVGFDCREILHEGGAVHCMSQHQPAILA